MSLIVKIMKDDSFADDSPYKQHSLITGVISLDFLLTNGGDEFDPGVLLYFGRGEEPEYHRVDNNVYVMNEAGKTISSWAVPVQVPERERKTTVEVFLGKSRISLLDKPYKGRDLCREMAVSHDRELQIMEFNTSDSDGEWVRVHEDKLYFPGDGCRFREVPE